MNVLHHWLCRSGHWRSTVRHRVPWVLAGHDLGPRVLELGPGPGLTTELLQRSVPHLTALELDPTLAAALRFRLAGDNVEVVTGDATVMPFPDEHFSAAVSFTMLHHIPSRVLQDTLLREVWRVLKPDGIFVGSDSLQSWLMRLIHIGDTLVPIDPVTFGGRLAAAGFEGVMVEKNSEAFRFFARRPMNRTIGNGQILTSKQIPQTQPDIGTSRSGGTDMRNTHHLSQTLRALRFAGFALAVGLSIGTTAFAANDEQPCTATPEIRQLDYWLGNWTMGSGADKSTSKVSLSLDKCVFLEHWQNERGHIAEKFFAYSSEEKNWYGMFVDNQGRVHVFINGKVSPDMAEFWGPSRGPNGDTILNRLKVVRVSGDKLEEVWEKSTDNGTNWTTAYRAQYSRGNP